MTGVKRRKVEVDKRLQAFHDYLLQCKSILALCGAGLSASSGLPTFRGSQGLWKNFSSIDLATPDAFDVDPGLVWQFYTYRRYCALNAEPNDGHKLLANLCKTCTQNEIKYLNLNQNVDGLTLRAGHLSENHLELHGSLFDLRCTNFVCTYKESGNFKHPLTPLLSDCEEEFAKEVKPDQSPEFQPVQSILDLDLPHCPLCKTGLLRPGVVWFGEPLPLRVIDKVDEFLVKNDPVDLILVIGTSASVWPLAGYIDRVRQQGGKIAVFNTEIENIEEVENINEDNEYGGFAFLGDAAVNLPKLLSPLIGDDLQKRHEITLDGGENNK